MGTAKLWSKVEKWKKLLILSLCFYLLHLYLSVTVGWSSPAEVGPPIMVVTRIIPPVLLFWAYDSWRKHKGKGLPFSKFNWKTFSLMFLVIAIASYVFAAYLYMNPGFSPQPGADQFHMIGAILYGTLCFGLAIHMIRNHERIQGEVDRMMLS
ncbi:MAG: hypothetical protein ACFFF9_05210 [Candidatus Thorarchaeota archaeon]